MKKQKESEKIECPRSDLRLLIFGCFRYSLGRRTYMPSFTVEMIKKHQEIFSKYDWEMFIREIDECNDLGMECDTLDWNNLKNLAKKKICNYNT